MWSLIHDQVSSSKLNVNRNLMWTKLLAKVSFSVRTEILKALLVDLSGQMRNLLEVSRKIAMAIIGSWQLPRVPVT